VADRWTTSRWALLVCGWALACCAAAAGAILAGADQEALVAAVAAALVGLPLAYLAFRTDPAYLFAGAIVLSPFSGNWEGIGIPGVLAADRLLLVVAILAVLARAVTKRDDPPFRLAPAHWILALAAVYALLSAAIVGTLFERAAFFRLLEAYGFLPFLAFAVAPLAFRTARQRMVLLASLVALGAYLGLTALFEAINLNALVFPRYILDEDFGIHQGRSRGPFVQAATNGLALYACALASGMATVLWTDARARVLAAGIAVLCLVGCFLTLQRSSWLGAILATVALLAVARGTRRVLIPAIGFAAACLALSLVAVPGLAEQARERGDAQRSVWDRLNSNRAALNMVEASPLVGFGWGEYDTRNVDYYEQSPDYPLTGARVNLVHNVVLGYAAELGLVGTMLWALALALAVGGALITRGPPDLAVWRLGLLGVAVFFAIVQLVTPPKAFPTLLLMLWAGVVWSGRYPQDDALEARAGGVQSAPQPVSLAAGGRAAPG